MEKRGRVLYIAYLFPPIQSIACVRSGNTAKYLARLGWDVTVVTIPPNASYPEDKSDHISAEIDAAGVRRLHATHPVRSLSQAVIHTSRFGIRGLVKNAVLKTLSMLGSHRFWGWYLGVLRTCADIKPGQYDVILATGSPWTSFELARKLAKQLQCPYVLDYRDLWAAGAHKNYVANTWSNRRLERRLLRHSAAVSVVSPSMNKSFTEHFGTRDDRVRVITNGFDPDQMEGVKPFDFGHPAIVYAGRSWIPPRRNLEPLARAVKRLDELLPDSDWRFHYYGEDSDYAEAVVSQFGIRARTVIHGRVPRSEVLSAIAGAKAASVLISVLDRCDLFDAGVLTGKLFEIIGLGTPLLAVAPSGSDIETIVNTVGNGRVFPGSATDGMAGYLAGLIQGEIRETTHGEQFAWPRVIEQVDGMLRSVCNGASGRR